MTLFDAPALRPLFEQGKLFPASALPAPAVTLADPDAFDLAHQSWRDAADIAAEPTDVQRDLADAAAFESAYSDWLLSQGEEEYRQWKEYVESLPTADEVAAGFAAAGEADPFN